MATPGVNCCYFQWGLIGINSSTPIDSCPAILGEYSDRSLFPTGTTVGEIAVERYSTDLGGGDVEYIVNFYSWTGVFWNRVVFFGSILSSGETSLVAISTSTNYEASVDLGATWETSNHNFGSPVTGFPVWFRNTVNG